MFLVTGRAILLILFATTFIYSQSYLPLAGKWSQTDSRDLIGIWKVDTQQAILDGTGKGTINNITARLGTTEGIPFTIDFTGDSRDEIAIYYPNSGLVQFYADIYNGKLTSAVETGITNAIPLSGRWGYGNTSKDGYALYQSVGSAAKIYFFQSQLSSSSFQQNSVGNPQDIPIAGDWDGDGLDGFALFHPDRHQIDFYQAYNSRRILKKIDLGQREGIALAGDWTGNGTDYFALYANIGTTGGQFWKFAADTNELTDSCVWTDQPLYDISGGRQLIYTAGVPHTDIDGRMMSDYDPARSFFPKGIDKINLDSLSQIRAAGFNLGILSGLDYPIRTHAREALDAFENDFRMILPFQELGGHPFVGKSSGWRDMVGIYDQNNAFIAFDSDGDHTLDYQKQFGMGALQIVRGDWNGDGIDGYAIVQANNQVRIGDTMDEAPGYAVNMPFSGTLLAMDNDKDPEDEYAIFHDSLLTYYSSIYTIIGTTIQVPSEGDMPIIGDWNGDGKDGFALYKPSTKTVRFYEEVDNTKPLRFKLVNTITVGSEGDELIAGDWDGDGTDGIGFYHSTPARDRQTFIMYDDIYDLSVEVDSASTENPMVDSSLRKYTYGMYTFDEPSGSATTLTDDYLQRLYSSYIQPKGEEPAPLFYHTDTQIIPNGDNRRDFWEKMNQFGEVVSHDDYPIGNNVHSIARIGETVGCSVRDDRPNWLTIQTFASPSNNLVAPTPEQVKSMIYTAVVHGATGIFSFMYHDPVRFPEYTGLSPSSNPSLWRTMIAINAELDQLSRFIFTKSPEIISSTSGEPDTDFRIYTRQPPPNSRDYDGVNGSPIRTLLKRDPNNGDYLLMAVNITDQPFDAVVSLPNSMQPTDGRIIKRMFEGSDLVLTAGAINDSFAPFAVHLYQISSGEAAALATAGRTRAASKIFSIRSRR